MSERRVALGRAVEAARLAHRWSKEQASRQAGISSITWKRIEDGLNVHDVKLYAALEALDIDESGAPRATDPDADLIAQIEAANISDGLKREVIARLRADDTPPGDELPAG